MSMESERRGLNGCRDAIDRVPSLSASAITPVGSTSSFNYVIIDTKSDKRMCLNGYHHRLLRPCGCTGLSIPHVLREISLHILHDCNMPLNRRRCFFLSL